MKTSTVGQIRHEVELSLTRHACSPQRWDQLHRRLASVDPELVATALLACLEDLREESRLEQGYVHGLLRAISPRSHLAVDVVLAALLPRWHQEASDLSAWLASAYGTEELHRALDRFDRATGDERLHEKTRRMRCQTGRQVLP
jgi:hypothetical protein